jgi:flagellar hook protein FlgE
MPFQIALSGLNAASTDLQVTGHNIANAGTTGFKQSRAEFADLYANSIQDVSSTSSGRGVRVSRVAQQFSQGTVDFTSNSLDLAINGEGFYILRDQSGNQSYTRAGAFGADRDGNVVNHSGQRLQVFTAIDPAGTQFNTGTTQDLVLPTISGAPQATSIITTALNLDASETPPTVPFDTANPANITTAMYNHATATTVYDSLGTSYTQALYYSKTGVPGEWNVHTTITDPTSGVTSYVDGPSGTTATIQFDSAGRLDTTAGDVTVAGVMNMVPYAPTNGASNLQLNFDYALTTQYGGNFSVNNLTQDGFTTGQLSGVDIDNQGVVFARFTNGNSTSLGKIALAKFQNPQGLRQKGDTAWTETFTSGDLQRGEAGTSSFGLIQSGALEISNVDIAAQLVNLITAQRNFQANAQVISTADTVTQTIINIR